ncbi:MAG: acyl carrier protein [Oscillospiraceae bacterium]|nr:acyl carrier protein [Oscillospiraceae bacterium]MBP1570284.1 acyl carrier protein [Oscillospiraceae bacterium]MBQ5314211.1 acyl carrier protein [Oscillospiraceae bacterium]MBQ5324097.1 acyl carrier protein [Oscillospiraceae bacterium]
MTREAIFEELTEIFRDIFDDEEIELTDETTADDIEDWDSLEQINLLVAIEKKFSIKFKLDEVSHLANVGDMVDLVQKLVG